MTWRELGAWLPRQLTAYADLIAASGAMSAQDARDKAERDFARGFSDRFGTAAQLLFRVVTANAAVGWLWLSVPGPGPDPLMAWVYDIEIEGPFRGRGYGRAALRLAEEEARSRGMTSLGLSVQGHNTAARSLYDSLGYQVTELQMKKPV